MSNRIYRLFNSKGPSIMVVADSKETIERLAIHFRIIKNLKLLRFEDVTDSFSQYKKTSLNEVCKAPCGMAGVMFDGSCYQWQIITENNNKWFGTSENFN